MAENRENSGALFINKHKTEDKHPTMKGTINVDGKTFEIAGWSKIDKNGDKWLSLQVSEPRPKGDNPPSENTDDLPF